MPRRHTPRPQSVPQCPEPDRELVTVPEGAYLGNIGVSTAWKLIADRTWPSVKIGSRRLVPGARLVALLRGDEAEGAT